MIERNGKLAAVIDRTLLNHPTVPGRCGRMQVVVAEVWYTRSTVASPVIIYDLIVVWHRG